MLRSLALVFIVGVLAIAGYWCLRAGDSEPVPITVPTAQAPTAEEAAPPATSAPNPTAAVATPADAQIERSAAPATASSDQPPLPADAKWLEVTVVDAGDQQPVAGAEVLWGQNAMYQKVQTLPEQERRLLRDDSDLLLRRFGWRTRTDARGIARIATEPNGATVQARADGRFAVCYIGGQQSVPPEGWRLELEADRTLRGRMLAGNSVDGGWRRRNAGTSHRRQVAHARGPRGWNATEQLRRRQAGEGSAQSVDQLRLVRRRQRAVVLGGRGLRQSGAFALLLPAIVASEVDEDVDEPRLERATGGADLHATCSRDSRSTPGRLLGATVGNLIAVRHPSASPQLVR